MVLRIKESLFTYIVKYYTQECTFLKKINEKISRSGVIDTETINFHDLCYQCYKHGTDCLFGKFRIKGFIDEPSFPDIYN